MTDNVPYMTLRYRAHKALGHCPICGGDRDLPGRINCSKCLAQRHEIYARKAARMTAKEKAARNERASEVQKNRRKRLRAQGLCATCGAPSPDRYYCETCRAKQRNRPTKKGALNRG